MSTNWITFATIGGPLVNEIRKRFAIWQERGEFDAYGKSTRIEDPTVIADMKSLASAIESNAARPPIFVFHKFVDNRTLIPSQQLRALHVKLKKDIKLVQGPEYDVAFLETSNPRSLNHCLLNVLKRLKSGFYSDDRRLISVLRDCVVGRQEFLKEYYLKSAVFMAFDALGPSWYDPETFDLARTVPTWFSPYRVTCIQNAKDHPT